MNEFTRFSPGGAEDANRHGVHAIVQAHPFEIARAHAYLPPGSTVIDVVKAAGVASRYQKMIRVYVDDVEIDREKWIDMVLDDKTNVYIMPVPGKGDVLKQVLMLTVVVAAAIAAPFLAGVLLPAGASALLTTGVTLGIQAGLTLVGSYLVNSLIPPPSSRPDEAISQRDLLTGVRNRMVPYAPIPRIIGKRRSYPLMASRPYTENVGGKRYLRALLLLGWGPLKVSDIKIGETPISAFTNIEYEVREGWTDDTFGVMAVNAAVRYDFAAGNDGLSAANATLTVRGGVLKVTPTTTDPNLLTPAGLTIAGATNTLVRAKIRRIAGSGWEGTVLYTTSGHGFSSSFRKTIASPVSQNDEWVIAEWDMSALTVGGADWTSNTITRLRFDFSNASGDVFEVEWIEVGARKTADAARTLFTSTVLQDDYGVLLNPSTDVIRTTQTDTSEIGVDISFPSGLIFYGKKGTAAYTVEVTVQYRAVGAVPWTDATWVIKTPEDGTQTDGKLVCADETSAEVLFGGTFKTPAPGQYEVKVRRTTAAGSSNHIGAATLASVKSIRYADPVNVPGVATLAVRLRATNQFQSFPDQINCIVESYLPIYDGATWRYDVTRCPAWGFADILRRRGTERIVSDTRINVDALRDWAIAADAFAPNADEPYWAVDAILENESIFSAVKKVSSHSRASLTIVDGQYSVVRDIEQTVPVQHITPKNSWGYKGAKALIDLPHALRVNFTNAAKGYQEDEVVVYDDGYDENNATRFEALDLPHCSSDTMAWREARYHIAVGRLRPEEHSVQMDIENLRCTRGDLVRFSHDVVSIGISWGRVTAIATSGSDTTGITLDETVTMVNGTNYAVRARRQDGVSVVIAIQGVGVTTETRVLTFSSPVATASGPSIGDLVLFGVSGIESAPMIVKKIDPGEDLTATVIMVDAQSGIYTADTGVIPPFNSYITDNTPPEQRRPDTPSFTLYSGETVVKTLADGTVQDRIAVAIASHLSSKVTVGSYEIQWRLNGASQWGAVKSLPVDLRRHFITPVDRGRGYDVRVRAISLFGVPSEWAVTLNHVVAGFTVASSAPSGLSATGGYGAVALQWTAPADFIPGYYEVWASATNNRTAGSAVGISSTPSFSHGGLGNGVGRYYWVRAIDAVGNASAFNAGDTSGVLATTLIPTAGVPGTPSLVEQSVVRPDGSIATTVRASWSAGSNAVSYVVGITEGAQPETTVVVGAAAHAFGARPGVLYSVRVASVNQIGTISAFSAAATITPTGDTTAPGVPTGLQATSGLLTSINLNWTNPADKDLSHIEVYEHTANSPFASATKIAEVSGTMWTRDGLASDVVRYYWIKAVDRSGNASAQHPAGNGVEGSTQGIGSGSVDTTPPSVPTGLAVTSAASIASDGGTQVKLIVTWNKVSELDLAFYELGVLESGGTEVVFPAGALGTATERHEIFGVKPNVSYTVRIKSVDRLGNRSAFSSGVSHTTAKDSVAPATPTGLSISAGFENIWIQWSANTESDLAEYQIFQQNAVSPAPNAGTSPTYRSGSTTVQITGLAPGVPWWFWVRAVDTSGNASAWSAALTETPVRIESGDIAAGIITDAEIAANAITASKFAVGDFSNLMDNPIFAYGGLGWEVLNGAAFETSAGNAYISGKQITIPAGTYGVNDIMVRSRLIPIQPGDVYMLRTAARFQASSAGLEATAFHAIGYVYDSAGAAIGLAQAGRENNYVEGVDWSGGVATNYLVKYHHFTIPTGAAFLRVLIRHNSLSSKATDSAFRIGEISLIRVSGSVLIADGAVTADKVTTGELITLSAQIKDAIINDAKITNLSAAKLTAGTALAGSITVSGTALSTINSNATLGASDPATRINAAATQIDPGKILISGATTLADWRSGGDATKIDGGNLAANSIAANRLVIGMRNIAVEGVEFQPNTPSTNKVAWSAGTIRYYDDAGSLVTAAISANAVGITWTTGVVYLYWVKGATSVSNTTNPATAFGTNNVVLAMYEGGGNLQAVGRVVIDGGKIVAQSIDAGQIKAGAIQADKIAANAVTASKVLITNTQSLVMDYALGDTAYWFKQSTWAITTDATAVAALKAPTVFQTPAGDGSTSQAVTYVKPNNDFAVQSGETLYCEASAFYRAGFSGRLRIVILWYKEDGSPSSTSITIVVSGTDYRGAAAGANTTETLSGSAVIPSDAASASWRVQVLWPTSAPAAQYAAFARPICLVKNAGKLVVDGSIQASHLSVTSLDAITANMGTLTAGLIESPNFVSGAAGFHIDADTGEAEFQKITVGGGTSTKRPFQTSFGIEQDGLSSDEGLCQVNLPKTITGHSWLNLTGTAKRTPAGVEYNLSASFNAQPEQVITGTYARASGMAWAPATRYVYEDHGGIGTFARYYCVRIDAFGDIYASAAGSDNGYYENTLIASFLNEADQDQFFRDGPYDQATIWVWKDVLLKGPRRIRVPETVLVSSTPTPVTGMRVWMWGAASQRNADKQGSPGGYVKFDHTVEPDEILSLLVGGHDGQGFGGCSPMYVKDYSVVQTGSMDAQGGGGSFLWRGAARRANILGVAGGGGGPGLQRGSPGGGASSGGTLTGLDMVRCMGFTGMAQRGTVSGGGGYEGGVANVNGANSGGAGGSNYIAPSATATTNLGTSETASKEPTVSTPPGTAEQVYIDNSANSLGRAAVGANSGNYDGAGPGMIAIQWLT